MQKICNSGKTGLIQNCRGRWANQNTHKHLITRFHQFGDIRDVKEAESIYKKINKTYNNTLPGPFVALTSSAMLQHHFIQADTLFEKAKKIGVDGFISKYPII